MYHFTEVHQDCCTVSKQRDELQLLVFDLVANLCTSKYMFCVWSVGVQFWNFPRLSYKQKQTLWERDVFVWAGFCLGSCRKQTQVSTNLKALLTPPGFFMYTTCICVFVCDNMPIKVMLVILCVYFHSLSVPQLSTIQQPQLILCNRAGSGQQCCEQTQTHLEGTCA